MLTDAQQECFTRLWTAAQPAVSGYLHALVRDAAIAEDLIQETALALLRKFPEYDAQRPFLPWALGVAKFQILSHRRDAARSRILFDDELVERLTQTWGEAAPRISGEQAALSHCLQTLTPRARNLLFLRYDQALDSAQIARKLSSTAGAVRVALQRVREQLRDCVRRRLQTEGDAA